MILRRSWPTYQDTAVGKQPYKQKVMLNKFQEGLTILDRVI